jgi:HlyD family secretion protein
MKQNNILIGSVVGIVIIIAVWFGIRAMQTPASVAHTVSAGNHDVVQEVQTTGVVQPTNQYDLSFGISGVLAKVYVHKGDAVKAGQILANLDASDIAMQRASANATLIGDQQVTVTNLTNAQQSLDQVKKANIASIANATQKVLDTRAYMNKMQDIFTDVSNNGDIDTTSITYITAAQSLANARNNYNEAVTTLHALQATANQLESAGQSQILSAQVSSQLKSGTINTGGDISVNQAQLGYQNAVLAKTILRAPAAGIITSDDVQVGEYASPAKSTMTIISSSLEIKTQVSEVDIAHVQVGQMAQITFDAIGLSDTFDAKVTSIDSVATEQDGVSSYGISLQLVSADMRIKAGMTANIAMTVSEKKDVLAVPSDAVFVSGNEFFVNVPDADNASHKQSIQLGIRGTNGYDEIASGLSSGQSVLSFSSK